MQKAVSIVIPVFNKWNFTKSCLNDLIKLPSSHEIILIDNASSDETKTELPKLCDELNSKSLDSPRIGSVRNEENVFHSKACNQGARLASGEIILFLNNDIRVRSNHGTWTGDLIKACVSTMGLVGPTMGQLDKNLNFVKEANQQLDGNCYLGGWCIAAKRSVWEKLDLDGKGQFWNEEFPFYFNDTDLSFRARRNKIPLTVIPIPEIAHFGKVSAQQINIPKLYSDGRRVFLKHWSK